MYSGVEQENVGRAQMSRGRLAGPPASHWTSCSFLIDDPGAGPSWRGPEGEIK